MNMHDTANFSRLQHECVKMKAERDELRERLDCSVKNLKSMENKMNDLREQLDAVRDIARKTKVPKSGMIVTPRSPQQAIREILDILQPDSGKDGG